MNFNVCTRFAFACLFVGLLFQFGLESSIPAIILYGCGGMWSAIALYSFSEEDK